MLGGTGSVGQGYDGSRPQYTLPPQKEPTKADVFYQTSNGGYRGHWYDGTPGHKLGDVPTIAEVLGTKPTVRKPVRPLITTAQTLIADQIKTIREGRNAERVISADVVPKKFPSEASAYQYPPPAKKGSDNPLYATSSQNYGKEPPMDHQVPDRYFPSTNNFTKRFVDHKNRYTGLNTAWTPSRIHDSMDEFF